MVAFSAIALLILFLFLTTTLALPVSGMFHAGIACAAEDMHRVTPQDPWVFFWRGARVKFRRIAFALFVLMALGALLSWRLHDRHGNWIHTIHTASLPPAIGLSVLATGALVCFLLAPRFATGAALGAAVVSITLVLMIGGEIALALLLPDGWSMVEYTYQNDSGGGVARAIWLVPAFPLFHCAISVLLCWAAWRWAKRQGQRWFRFEG